MNDCQCLESCKMRLELKKATDKLAFIRDNWSVFGQPESIDNLSDIEMQCLFCLIDTVIQELAEGETSCSAPEAIRLQITRTIIDNNLQIRELVRQRTELEDWGERLSEGSR